MANLPPSFSMAPSFAAPGAPIAATAVSKDQNMATVVSKDQNIATAEQLVLNLCNPELRETALQDLSKKREIFQDLAPLLWHSFGTIAALLQEIVSIYPSLSPPTLSPDQSNRVCNALVLLQVCSFLRDEENPLMALEGALLTTQCNYECVAANPDTRHPFLAAQIPVYLYPFLNTLNKARQYEYLRLTSLGVIGALVKVDDPEVISFLLGSEIIPLCLRAMDMGSELSKTVATFIIQKIMLDDTGLHYVCATYERYAAVVSVLALMVESAEHPSPRLLKHIIRCYLRLTENAKARSLLHEHLPISLINGSLNEYLQDDLTMRWLRQLVHNVIIASRGGPHTGLDHMMGM